MDKPRTTDPSPILDRKSVEAGSSKLISMLESASISRRDAIACRPAWTFDPGHQYKVFRRKTRNAAYASIVFPSSIVNGILMLLAAAAIFVIASIWVTMLLPWPNQRGAMDLLDIVAIPLAVIICFLVLLRFTWIPNSPVICLNLDASGTLHVRRIGALANRRFVISQSEFLVASVIQRSGIRRGRVLYTAFAIDANQLGSPIAIYSNVRDLARLSSELSAATDRSIKWSVLPHALLFDELRTRRQC